MKHIFTKLLFIGIFALTMVACSEEDYSSKYADPSKTNDASCEKLMTGVFYAGREYTFNSYMRIFAWDYSAISRFAQTLGFLNSEGRYQNSDNYYEERWNNFYDALTQYRVLEDVYSKLSDASKPNYEVFVLLSRIFVYDHLIQVSDCWGDVPFTKAGYLAVTSNVAESYPAYDTAESIYSLVLTDLKSINDQLANMTSLSTLTSSALKAQDFINGGDLMLWRKYCNSLRLRVATRVADNGSLKTEGQAAIREMLENPSKYPMVDNNDENIKVVPDRDGFNYGDGYQGGWETWSGQLNRASQAMIDALEGDSRLVILFDANSEGNYVGVDTRTDYATQVALFERPNNENYYCSYDTATFSRNRDMPGIIISAAEVALYKASAINKGYASGDAKEAFVNGMVFSTEFYYDINSTATYRPPTPPPAAEDVIAFAENKWETASNKEEVIATQTWLNFGFLQTTQAWSEIRRSGYPELYFPTDHSSSTNPNVPNRLRYPPSERNSNPENYNLFKDKDNFTDKMFWAK
ncbi:MAG: SusD/RagB family nutrient-binding outer membrane lipoprotein [Bacteroidota bacterium]|jgi:hypothetical protein|nr:SusD/RagB family nutrient-binding outer membrane lipoprotein [Bacteroidota bacterium]HHU95754.1 SusD/RagB family nutrient-binding outer membrane lipoprotein [Petrimonas sp.]